MAERERRGEVINTRKAAVVAVPTENTSPLSVIKKRAATVFASAMIPPVIKCEFFLGGAP
jgi:hypothetical protein